MQASEGIQASEEVNPVNADTIRNIVVETITTMVYRVMSSTIFLSPSKLMNMYNIYVAMKDYKWRPVELSVVRYYLEIIAEAFGFKIYSNKKYRFLVAIEAGKLRKMPPEKLRKVLYEVVANA